MPGILKTVTLAILAATALAAPHKGPHKKNHKNVVKKQQTHPHKLFDTTTWGYGLSYSPYNSDSSCKQQDAVNTDFEQLGDYGFIRAYGTDCNQTSTILTAAKANGQLLFAGVFNLTELESEVQLIIDAAAGDWSSFAAVSVGNEGVNDGTYSVDDVVAAVGSARSQLQAAGYTGPVVTVDTSGAIIANPQLCQASDFAAANCHAFFNAKLTPDQAGSYVSQQAAAVQSACGGQDTLITESGWPSQGDTNGNAVPSLENQQTAIASLKSSFANNIVLFTAYNNFWAQNNAYTFNAEQWWGILGNSTTSGPA